MLVQLPSAHGYFDLGPAGAPALTIGGTVGKHEGGTMLPYQRDVSNSTNVVLSGTYSGGTPSGIQVSWKGGAFVSLTSMTIAGGSWTGTFGAQAGDEGTLTLRWTNNTDLVMA